MTKEEITKAAASDAGCRTSTAEAVLNAFLKHITEELSAGNKVRIVGFGTFEPQRRAARIGRNPKTNEEVTIPERVVPYFRPGARLVRAVNGACRTRMAEDPNLNARKAREDCI